MWRAARALRVEVGPFAADWGQLVCCKLRAASVLWVVQTVCCVLMASRRVLCGCGGSKEKKGFTVDPGAAMDRLLGLVSIRLQCHEVEISVVNPMMCFFVVDLCTDVLKVGVWQLLQDIDDPELRKLAHSLPMTVLRSRATGSTRKYLGAFRRWKAWAKGHALPVFPAQGHHVALYL